MADFRKWILAFVAVAMLISLVPAASAQTTLSCNATATVPPLLRSEGQTELSGDILLTCTNVIPQTPIPIPAAGAAVPTANFTIFYNTNVTSRLLGTSNGLSEALLLMNDTVPNSTNTCTSLTGCYPAGSTVPSAGLAKTSFEGIVSGNSVTFVGVPVVPPGSPGTTVPSFSYRLTNVRVNASTASANTGVINGINVSGLGQIVAFITITGPTAIGVPNPQQGVGFTQKSMNFSVLNTSLAALSSSNILSFAQCNTISRTKIQGYLRYTELFPSAFKTRATDAAGTGSGQQTVGTIYNTESGLVVPTLTGTYGSATTTVGLADFGTRLKAVFANIPAGVSVYVTRFNLDNSASSPVLASGTTPPGTDLAQLTSSETGAFSAVAEGTTDPGGFSSAQVVAAAAAGSVGSGTAVWEVTSANLLASTNFDFGFAFAKSGSSAALPQTAGTVYGSYAPSASTVGSNSGSALVGPIPRFIDNTATTAIINLVVCRTNLLFPYVVNVASFDTGLAISNTSVDGLGTTGVPFGDTGEPNTACALYFFGDGTPSTNPVPLTVNAGKTAAILASSQAPGFVGYVIAQCQFRFAHGFAYIADSAGGHAAMGYLPLVIPDNPVAVGGTSGSTRTSNTNSAIGFGEWLSN